MRSREVLGILKKGGGDWGAMHSELWFLQPFLNYRRVLNWPTPVRDGINTLISNLKKAEMILAGGNFALEGLRFWGWISLIAISKQGLTADDPWHGKTRLLLLCPRHEWRVQFCHNICSDPWLATIVPHSFFVMTLNMLLYATCPNHACHLWWSFTSGNVFTIASVQMWWFLYLFLKGALQGIALFKNNSSPC